MISVVFRARSWCKRAGSRLNDGALQPIELMRRKTIAVNSVPANPFAPLDVRSACFLQFVLLVSVSRSAMCPGGDTAMRVLAR